MRAKDALGQYGQRIAESYLVESGLTVVDRNWRCPDGELDLIATEGPVLVFCEVKTRSSTAYGDPAEAVLGAKALRLRRLALRWLAHQQAYGDPRFWPELRFDVVSVLRAPRGAATVWHLRGVLGW
jgi:putative endonuclease